MSRIVHFTKLREMWHSEVRGTLTSMGSISREKVRQKHDGQMSKNTSKRNGFGSAWKMGILRTPGSKLEVLVDHLNRGKDMGGRSGKKEREEG